MVCTQTYNRSRFKRMSTLQGKLRQKIKGGQYYYRLTIAKGNRKEFSLGTTDPDEACKKAEELDSIWLAPTSEVALAQMNVQEYGAEFGVMTSSMEMSILMT